MAIIETILLRALLTCLALGSFAGLIVGAILIVKPHWLVRVNLIANRWVSTRHIDKLLETPINIDPWFYRYRLASALVTLAGAIYVLYFFGVHIDKASAISALAKHFQMPATYIGALFDPMIFVALLGSTFALFVSLLVLFHPRLFQKFERGANKWISLRRALKPMEIPRNNLDEFTFRHTQQMGVMLVIGSIYTLALLTFWAR